jgi:hypothetical protein
MKVKDAPPGLLYLSDCNLGWVKFVVKHVPFGKDPTTEYSLYDIDGESCYGNSAADVNCVQIGLSEFKGLFHVGIKNS